MRKLGIGGFGAVLALLAALVPVATLAAAQTEAMCEGTTATIVGTEGDDVLTGTAGNDVIVGLGGNDVIRGLRGDDLICGDAGRDRLFGGKGNDNLFWRSQQRHSEG